MEWVSQFYRKLWTMLVELGLIVTLSIQMGLVSTPTLSKLTAIMLSTAISRKRVKLKALVILLEVLPFPLLIPVSSLFGHSLLAIIFPGLPNGKKVNSRRFTAFPHGDLQVLPAVLTLLAPGMCGPPFCSLNSYLFLIFFLIFPFGKFSLST